MKFFTNKGVIQKTILAMVIVMVTTFCVPTVVHADIGGKLMSPIINFVAAIFDGVQHMLERTMIGETSSFMKTIGTDTYKTSASSKVSITTDEFIDVTFWGINKVNVPVIQYTPEAIFSNQVPALDVNFIKPSVQGDDDRNVAKQLRPIIASWYVALRSIAIVGLLSVLVYLGIRMLLTSIAADRAKYKQMLVDWVVAMCLVFVLHYIMSFALTMVESVTAMLASEADGTFTVHATNVDGILLTTYQVDFAANLMSYVRFMVQAGDLQVKIAFLALYIMLVIFSIRFTWVYGKRVVNMAFLTLIAPMVALTYPIDKVSDGKAQAFNMWLKEFTYNALIQPIHLLLYKVLLGTAIDLAVDNVLYAIIALGFIIAAEKLVKQMFGFNKASGGTVGSLAGAAGVTAVAGNMLKGVAKNGPGPGGKVRTKDSPERQGKDADGNKPFKSFQGKGENDVVGAGDDTSLPSPDQGNSPPENPPSNGPSPEGNDTPPPENNNPLDDLEKQLEGYDDTDPYFLDPEHQRLQEEYQTQREQANKQNEEDVPLPDEGNPVALDNNNDTQPNFWDTVKQDTGNFFQRGGQRLDAAKDAWNNFKTPEGKKALVNRLKSGANKRAIGAWKALPTVGYKAARGTLKVASRAALAAAMGGVGLAIGATTGDGEKAASMALGAAAIGGATGGNVFEATVGKRMRDKSIADAYGAGKYGNAIDARNAKADQEYFRSDKFNNFYEKEFKKDYSKKEFTEAVRGYRKAGVTSERDIKKSLKLEQQYKANNPNNLSDKQIREQVQNIVASYNELGSEHKKAFAGDKKAEEALKRDTAIMLGGDTEANRKLANTIYKGYEDYRRI